MPLKATPTTIEMRDRAVWLVEHDGDAGTQGTCFFLQGVGLVTAAHCVENVEAVDVYHPSKPANRFQAKVLKRHEHRDLALRACTSRNRIFPVGKSGQIVVEDAPPKPQNPKTPKPLFYRNTC